MLTLITRVVVASLVWAIATFGSLTDTHAAVKASTPKKAAKNQSRVIRREGDLNARSPREVFEELRTVRKIRQVDVAKQPALTGPVMERDVLDALVDEKLNEEIELAQSLLELETDCESVSSVRFRLADMFWEKSRRYFFKSNETGASEASIAADLRAMRQAQSQSLAYYERILEECLNYTDLPKIMYYLGNTLVELARHDEALTYYTRIIKEYAQSEWVPRAWYMLGEHYFNVRADAIRALKSYEKAASRRDSPVYGYALYKMGWCYINVADWQRAMTMFRDVMQASLDTTQRMDETSRVTLYNEGLKDYVRAYAHVGSVTRAFADFSKLVPKDKVLLMMETLGNLYVDQGAHRNAAAIYHEIIDSFPDSLRLPVFQGRIVEATNAMGDRIETARQTKVLTTLLNKTKRRVAGLQASQNVSPELLRDIAEAEEAVESTLRRLALDYTKDALRLPKSEGRRQLDAALEIFASYFDAFGEARFAGTINYALYMRFYYADVLYKVERFRDAAIAYDAVVKLKPNTTTERENELVQTALEESVRSNDEIVKRLDAQNPPQLGGLVAKPIPEAHRALIASCKQYVDLTAHSGSKTVEIQYKMARTYYTFNHFQDAAHAFTQIVETHPEHALACYAANLTLDIYNGLKNYAALKAASHVYNRTAKLACSDTDKQRFVKIEEQASFALIKEEFESKGKFVEAADLYLEFYKNYTSSDLADDALYNAALNFDLAHRVDRADEVRNLLFDKIPTSPLVADTMFNMAESRERIADFAQAAHYLQLFASRYPRDKRSKAAMFNAALYLSTLEQFAEAKALQNLFVATYPDDEATAQMALGACITEEAIATHRLSDSREAWLSARACYTGVTQSSAFQRDIDVLCHAHFQRLQLSRKHLDDAATAAQVKALLHKQYPVWLRTKSVKDLPRCTHDIAQMEFEEFENERLTYESMALAELNPSERGKQKFDASLRDKLARRDQLVAGFRRVVERGVPEWALRSLFAIGEVYRDSIEKLLAAPIPDKIPGYVLTAADKEMLRKELTTLANPSADLAVEAYLLCVKKSNELGIYNPWSLLAFERLQRMRPETYPKMVESVPRLMTADPPDAGGTPKS